MSPELYAKELEKLILNRYLPVYLEYHKDKSLDPKLDKLSLALQAKRQNTEIPAILKPRKENVKPG